MNNNEFERITESIVDGSSYNLSDEEKYHYFEEAGARLGIGFFDALIIDNTISYCEAFVEKYDKKEIIETVINRNYISYDENINEIVDWVVADLGYEKIE